MKRFLLIIILINCVLIPSKADRIFIMNSVGYNTAEPQMFAAISSLGHTVNTNPGFAPQLPTGFTSRCVDSVNGYDWLCFFGNANFTALLPQIQAFIDAGGKVYYQYEVSCCTVSSQSAADILSGLTGLTITPNSNAYIAIGGQPAWEATNVSCCANFYGNAYKGLDGMPIANQFLATANVGPSTPLISVCPNFGFMFNTNDFIGTANKGGITGVGDVNFWYDGDEPFGNGGSTPINMSLINYFFPNDTTTCYLFPPGCLQVYNGGGTTGISVNLGNDSVLCAGQTLLLNATTPGVTYQWQDNSTNPTFNVTSPGTYWVKITNICGNYTDTIHVSYISAPTFNLGNDTSLCIGQSLTLNATTVGATYLWQDNSTTPTYNISSSGTYWVQVTTSCGILSDTINILILPEPIFSLGNDTILCNGLSLTLNATTAGATYLWQDNSSNPTFTVTTSGTYWVKVTQGCSSIDSINVIFIGPPAINLGADKSVCFGDTVIINAATANATYLWQDNSTNSNFIVNQSGTYWVEVTVNNCTSSDTINVFINPYFSVNIGPDLNLCEGDTIVLNATTLNANYTWQNNSSSPMFTVTTSGTYWVDVIINNCTVRDSATINFSPVPLVNLGPDQSLCPNEFVILDATIPNATYLWNDNSKLSNIKVTQNGTYWVNVTVNNCVGHDEVTIDFLKPNCFCNVYLPNAFSPNNDTKNDVLNLINARGINLKEFRIYNRWGNEVFFSTNITIGWDGKYKGEYAENGTYFYFLKYTCIDTGKEYLIKGDVTLVN